ncbi:MAG: hypothetical protein AAB875_02260 [Patescibacteria group bacterium]
MTEQKEQKPDILARMRFFEDHIRIDVKDKVDRNLFLSILDSVYSYIEKSLKRDELLDSLMKEWAKDGPMPACRAWALNELRKVLGE